MITAWGYEVDAAAIPLLLDLQDFDTMTGGKYAGDLRAAGAISAASQAIRNFCGWHVSPSLACGAKLTASGRFAKLPANMVSAVSSVVDGGDELTGGQYEWRRDGLLRRACFRNFTQAWDGVEVAYTAGYESGAVPDLAEAVRAIAEGVLAVSAGVASESADGVSISYSANASSIAAALTEQQRTALMPYKLVSAHAA